MTSSICWSNGAPGVRSLLMWKPLPQPETADEFRARRARLLDLAIALEASDLPASIQVLELFVDGNAFDNRALLSLAARLHAAGRTRAAVQRYMTVLAYPDNPQTAAGARRLMDTIVDAETERLLASGRYPELAQYYRWLVDLEPVNDRFRLELARWLAYAGDVEQAERVLLEVGLTGVTQADIDSVGDHLRWRRSDIDVSQVDGQLVAAVMVNGVQSRLLVDTGASVTALSGELIDAAGAARLPGRVNVRTAGGRVVTSRYRVSDFEIGLVRFETLDVLRLPDAADLTDGLLGMDVLGVTGIPDFPGRRPRAGAPAANTLKFAGFDH